jgi:hypothetical protein
VSLRANPILLFIPNAFRRCSSDKAVLQNSIAPSLRSKGFEDEDDDENEYEAPYLLTARIKDELCRFHW